MAWRRNRRREVARLRKERGRRKLRNEARKGNKMALLKMELNKTANQRRSENYRRVKRERGDKA